MNVAWLVTFAAEKKNESHGREELLVCSGILVVRHWRRQEFRRSRTAIVRPSNCDYARPTISSHHECCCESKQSALGKRRFHAHCRNHARKRRGARAATRNYEGTQGAGSRLRRWHHGVARGETGRRRAGRRYRAEHCGGWEKAGGRAGPYQY